jgi:hypothetical protein
LIGVSFVLVVIVVSEVYLLYSVTSTTSELNDLKQNYAEFQDNATNLLNQQSALIVQYSNSTNTQNNLLNNLTNQLTTLESQYDSLNSNYSQIDSSYSSLNANYSNLLNNYNTLTETTISKITINSYDDTNWAILATEPSITSPANLNSAIFSTGSRITQFKDCLVWWSFNSTGIMISSYNLTSGLLTPACWYLATTDQGACDLEVINNTLYAAYGYATFPIYNGTIIFSSDLENWGTFLTENSICIESFNMYTGPGLYSGDIMFGGYTSQGRGTYAVIDCCANGSYYNVFTGTVLGSDDVLYLQMFNSTMMVGGDVAPSDPIYTNNGVNWVDSYTGSSFTAPYVFTWGSTAYTLNGTMWSTGHDTLLGNGNYGLGSWNGSTYQSHLFPINFTPFCIANTLVGGTEGHALYGQTGFPGNATIYSYYENGTLGGKVMDTNGTDLAVTGMIYNSTTGTYYALINDDYNGLMVLVQGNEIMPPSNATG